MHESAIDKTDEIGQRNLSAKKNSSPFGSDGNLTINELNSPEIDPSQIQFNSVFSNNSPDKGSPESLTTQRKTSVTDFVIGEQPRFYSYSKVYKIFSKC